MDDERYVSNIIQECFDRDINIIVKFIQKEITFGIELDDNFKELGFNSLDILDLILKCENKFNVDIIFENNKVRDLTVVGLAIKIWEGMM